MVRSWLNPRSGRGMDVLKVIFWDRCLSAPRSGKKWQFLVRLNGFQKETLCAQTPTAPRWKAHIETCQETRRKVVSGECCADRGPGSGAHAHTGRLPCVRRLGGQAHANVHSKRGHPHRAPHVRAGGDLSGDGDGGEGVGDTGGRAAYRAAGGDHDGGDGGGGKRGGGAAAKCGWWKRGPGCNGGGGGGGGPKVEAGGAREADDVTRAVRLCGWRRCW